MIHCVAEGPVAAVRVDPLPRTALPDALAGSLLVGVALQHALEGPLGLDRWTALAGVAGSLGALALARSATRALNQWTAAVGPHAVYRRPAPLPWFGGWSLDRRRVLTVRTAPDWPADDPPPAHATLWIVLADGPDRLWLDGLSGAEARAARDHLRAALAAPTTPA